MGLPFPDFTGKIGKQHPAEVNELYLFVGACPGPDGVGTMADATGTARRVGGFGQDAPAIGDIQSEAGAVNGRSAAS